MQRQIIGFDIDGEGDRVALLDCGHRQHVRHRPPFVNRAWAESEAGRAAMMGEALDCVRCDRLELPDGAVAYRETPAFDADSVPKGLLKDHTTKAGTWGRLEVLAGRVRYVLAPPIGRTLDLKEGESAAIPPEAPHHVEPGADAQFRVVFFRVEAVGE